MLEEGTWWSSGFAVSNGWLDCDHFFAWCSGSLDWEESSLEFMSMEETMGTVVVAGNRKRGWIIFVL